MEERYNASKYPLSCTRCGCAQSRVIRSQRTSQTRSKDPLPAFSRTRLCDHCGKQFRTRETVVEDRQTTAWRVTAMHDGKPSPADIEDLPPGEWPGLWSEFEVLVKINGVEYVLNTRNDMPIPHYPCRVVIDERGLRIISGVADDE